MRYHARGDRAQSFRAQPPKYCNDLVGFERRHATHESSHFDRLETDEFAFELRLSVFEKHFDYFTKILVEFVKCRSLRMCTGESGHIANIEPRVGAALDNCCEIAHFHDALISLPALYATAELCPRIA